jgi:hypothetical protein
MEDIVVTNVTARPMLTAGFVSLETPINEHSPKNLDRIKLLIKTMLIKIITSLLASIASRLNERTIYGNEIDVNCLRELILYIFDVKYKFGHISYVA